MLYLVVDSDFNRAWNRHNIGKVFKKPPSYTEVKEHPSLRFHFEWKPCGKLSNFLGIEVDGVFRSIPTTSFLERKFSIDRPLLTDEICDRIGKQLASDRGHWAQFVNA